jgi:hypothetical protein
MHFENITLSVQVIVVFVASVILINNPHFQVENRLLLSNDAYFNPNFLFSFKSSIDSLSLFIIVSFLLALVIQSI